jgi:hypothetical protein
MKTTEPDLNKDPSWEEIGKEIGMKMDATFMFNKRILDKVRTRLESQGYKATDFFEVNK